MRLSRVFVSLAVISALACSQKGYNTRVDFNSRVGAGADLSQVKTWNWVPMQHLPTGNPKIDNPEFLTRLERQITRALNERGLTQTSESPDFVVNYEIGIKTSYDDPDWMHGYSQESFAQEDTDWEVGNLTIIFFGMNTGQAIWAGWAQGELDPNVSRQQANENMDRTVNNIFERFDKDRGAPAPEVKTDY